MMFFFIWLLWLYLLVWIIIARDGSMHERLAHRSGT
jgi:hypothetical protein